MAPNPKHPGWGGHRPGAGAKPGRRKLPMPAMPGVRIVDPRPLTLRARDYTHLALAGFVRTLCDPKSPYPAVVSAAREMLDRGYGRAVEFKNTVNLRAFDGLSDAELDELISRLKSIASPAPVVDGVATETPDQEGLTLWVEAMGLRTSVPPPPPHPPPPRGSGG